MQTTLRIDDKIYRQVKTKSSELGLSITRFFEEAARERLTKLEQCPPRKITLPVSSVSGSSMSERTLQERIKSTDLDDDLAKLK